MRELGLPRVNSDNWYALISPGQSSPADRQKIQAAAFAAVKSQTVVDAYAAVGGIATTTSAEDLDTFLRAESVKWSAVIKRASVKLE